MADETCEHCGTALTILNSGWLPSDSPDGMRIHYVGECIAALRARAERAEKERDKAVDRVTALTIAIELHCPNVAEAMAFAETYGTFREAGEAMRVEDEKARAERAERRAERYREALEKASDALDDLAADLLASRPDLVLRLAPVRKALAATGDEEGKGGERR